MMERELLRKLFRLQRLLGRYYHYKLKKYGPLGNVHRGQGRILALLKLQPEISQKSLSDILDMRPQSLGQLLEKLESSGYITRSPSAEDLRVLNVRLTEAGRDLLDQNANPPDALELFAGFSEGEQAEFNDYLERLMATLEQGIGESGADCHSISDRHAHHHDRSGRCGRFFEKENG